MTNKKIKKKEMEQEIRQEEEILFVEKIETEQNNIIEKPIIFEEKEKIEKTIILVAKTYIVLSDHSFIDIANTKSYKIGDIYK